MFELHITDTDVTGGTIPVTWCFDREFLDEVKEGDVYGNDASGAHIVIVVKPLGCDKSKEVRYIAPLSDMVAYVSFKHPGENRIYAFIPSKFTKKEANLYLHRDTYGYDVTVVYEDNYVPRLLGKGSDDDDDDDDYTPHASVFGELARPIDVNVPEECFAKDPSGWELVWLTWLLSDRRFSDQCAVRRRRLFVYTIQPFILFFNVLLRTVIRLVALFIGSSGLSFRKLNPFVTEFPFVFDVFDRPIFIRPEPEDHESMSAAKYALVRLWPMPFFPPIVTLIVLPIVFPKVLTAYMWIGITILGLMAAAGIVALLASGTVGSFFQWLGTKLLDAPMDEKLEFMVCTGEAPKLPKKRSIRLRFMDLKSRMCKPYAG